MDSHKRTIKYRHKKTESLGDVIQKLKDLREERKAIQVESLSEILKVGVVTMQTLKFYARRYWEQGVDYEFIGNTKNLRTQMTEKMTYDYLTGVIENIQGKYKNWQAPHFLTQAKTKKDKIEKIKAVIGYEPKE